MNDYQYGQVTLGLSWHIVKTATRVPGRYRSLCGRDLVGDILDTLRPGEKSCESCLRLAVRAADPEPIDGRIEGE